MRVEVAMNALKKEAADLQRLLKGKTLNVVRRHRAKEVVLEFIDHTRLFVDWTEDGFEFSVTGTDDNED
jgi:hypothetical protein